MGTERESHVRMEDDLEAQRSAILHQLHHENIEILAIVEVQTALLRLVICITHRHDIRVWTPTRRPQSKHGTPSPQMTSCLTTLLPLALPRAAMAPASWT